MVESWILRESTIFLGAQANKGLFLNQSIISYKITA